jgi:acetoin utilization deacetylase AcuC-like enzyme
MPTRVALIDDDLFLQHEAPAGHPERAARLLAARRGVEASQWVSRAAGPSTADPSTAGSSVLRLAPRDASLDELNRVHGAAYLEDLQRIAGRFGSLDEDTFFSPQSLAAMLRAAGGSLALVDSVMRGEADFGFGLLRPPGHHACADRAMGFCSLNNAAIAARQAQVLGARKVLVLDWDVHHGNGTQDIFYGDPTVLYVSLHQWPQYPGTGRREERGSADGYGFTVNVPLSSQAGDEVYLEAFRRLVLPVVSSFAPDLTLISAGYDAHARDPLGGMKLSAEGYARMTRGLLSVLGDTPRMVFLLEGGYDLLAIEQSVQSTLDALLSTESNSVAAATFGAVPPAGFAVHESELGLAVAAQRTVWHL